MQRIDVHCHAVAPGYRQYAIANGHERPDGMPALPAWSPEQHIALMEKLNIDKSILSITSPGTHLAPSPGDDDAARMTRRANVELSEICRSHPAHFAFFASLPLPDVEGSVAEIDHALDVLGAVGFAVLSNANGVYLGDEALGPVFAKLNARRAVVFIHPTTCNLLGDDGQVQPAKPLAGYPRPMMEFMFDETRAVANLLLSGTVARYPDITYIMSHCGCALPSLLDRIGGFAAITGGAANQGEELRRLLRERFYFDLAGFPFPNQIHGLLRILGEGGEEKLVYGTDYPFTPEKVAVTLSDQLEKGCEELFDDEQRHAVYSGNAQRLFGFPSKS
ncbi:Amidohydrolase 2 [Apiospora rasikravindrae]|uniref:6-methylsalicylate decarboxylase n=1 Tax=Apiospora rasikravindrae TaxID=990691 RepID=A0ABR1SMK0_9PEZI